MTNTKRPLQVFLCHSSGDKPQVRELYRRLERDGINAWLDQEKLVPGQRWENEIPKAVKNSDVVIVCLSSQSITKEGYVQKEIRFALDAADEKPDGTIFIIPARLENCDVPDRINKFQWVDLFSDDGYERLMKALHIRAAGVGASLPPSDNNSKLSSRIEGIKQQVNEQNPTAPSKNISAPTTKNTLNQLNGFHKEILITSFKEWFSRKSFYTGDNKDSIQQSAAIEAESELSKFREIFDFVCFRNKFMNSLLYVGLVADEVDTVKIASILDGISQMGGKLFPYLIASSGLPIRTLLVYVDHQRYRTHFSELGNVGTQINKVVGIGARTVFVDMSTRELSISPVGGATGAIDSIARKVGIDEFFKQNSIGEVLQIYSSFYKTANLINQKKGI